jgi:DNA-binding CsgD family transcriptional regulator
MLKKRNEMNILTLIHEQLYGWATLLLLVYAACWFIQFKLCFFLIDEKLPPLWRISPAILIISAYASFVRPLIHNILFLILMLILTAILVSVFGRIHIFKSAYSAIIAFFVSFLGNICGEFLLLFIFPGLYSFFFESIVGAFILTTMEVLFPLLVLFVFPRSKFSLRLPIKDKSDPYDFIDIVMLCTFGCMFYFLAYATTTYLASFKENPQKIAPALTSLLIASFGIFGGVIIILKVMKKWYDLLKEKFKFEKEKREEDQRRFEIELRQNQKQIEILTKTLEELRELKVDQDKIDNVQEAIEQLKAYQRQLIAKKKYGFIFEKIINEKIEFDETQTQIIELIVEGKSNREIAEIIHLSEGRTANRITEILAKGGFKDRAALVAYYIIRDTFTDK